MTLACNARSGYGLQEPSTGRAVCPRDCMSSQPTIGIRSPCLRGNRDSGPTSSFFGQSPAERATETGLSERTVFRQVAQLGQLGMASFVSAPKPEKHRLLPTEVRQALLDAKREHPPLNIHELTTICWARYGHRPSAHTVKRILAEQPPPPRTHRRFRPYHAEPEPIRRRQPRQNYIEADFGVQRRLSDHDFAKAGSWPELLVVHDQWVTEHNDQGHFAHQDRPEERRSPAALLHRVCGRLFSPEELHRIFYSTRFGRVLDRAGYARFRRWRVYAENGLRGEPVAVWLHAEQHTLVYRDEPLAQSRVTYRRTSSGCRASRQSSSSTRPIARPNNRSGRGVRMGVCRCSGCRPTRRGTPDQLAARNPLFCLDEVRRGIHPEPPSRARFKQANEGARPRSTAVPGAE